MIYFALFSIKIKNANLFTQTEEQKPQDQALAPYHLYSFKFAIKRGL